MEVPEGNGASETPATSKRTRAVKAAGAADMPAPTTGRTPDQETLLILCESKSPILMDRFDENVMVDALVKGIRPPKDTQSLLEERCIKKIYRDDAGYPIIKAEHLLACLREAGRSIKVGKEKIAYADKTLLFSFLELEETEIRLHFPEGLDPKSEKPSKGGERDNDPKSPWRVDVRRGMLNAGGKDVTNALIRPMFEKWSFLATLNVDYTAVEGLTRDHIRKLVERAGNRVGLLSFRPACNGPFGRFRLADMSIDSKNVAA